MIMWIMLALMCIISAVNAEIIAYDCQSKDTEISRVSLLRVKPCLDPRNATKTLTRRMQLVQERRFTEVRVFTCMVMVQQLIQHCGMHSHTSAVSGGFGRYVHYVRVEACLNAHRFKRLDLAGIGVGVVSGLNLNGTTELSTTLEGHVDAKGNCKGVKYTLNDVGYEDVVITAAVTIRLNDYTAVANVEENQINLRSGTVCQYGSGYCFDDLVGEVTWEAKDADRCSNTGIDVLYEGPSTVLWLQAEGSTAEQRYVIVEAYDTVFALKLVSQEFLCQQQAWRTEQNRLLVIFDTSLGFFYRKSKKLVQNTDLMAQVLSKLLFLEIAVKRQMGEVIYDSILKRCRLRQKILENRLALALESPDIVSSLVKGAPGHVGRVVGEVLYIAKCSPKVVEYRKTEFCYQELPIWYKNATKFRTPITHVIQNHGTEVDFQRNLPPMFYLDGNWIEFTPEIQLSRPEPTELDANEESVILPMLKITPISGHGIYTREDMENFQRALLFPTERKAITSLVTRRVIGSSADPQGYDMPRVFSQVEFANFAVNAAEQVWGFLSRMGQYFSVFAFLYVTVVALNYIGNVLINFFALRRATKARSKPRVLLWASLWHALANCYLHHLVHSKEEVERELEIVVSQPVYPDLQDVVIKDANEPSAPPNPTTTEQSRAALDALRGGASR